MASSPFLNQVRQVMRLKHMSLSTEDSYLYHIKQFIFFHNKRHPKDRGVDEIRAYLSHLAVERRVSASTQKVVLSALLFLFASKVHPVPRNYPLWLLRQIRYNIFTRGLASSGG